MKGISNLLGKIVHSPSLAKVIAMGDVYIGVDKLEHMWSLGYEYFEDFYLGDTSLGETLDIGWRAEHKWLGLWVSDVLSYGDLLANFNGMRFWNHILQEDRDILGEHVGPYIQCKGSRWVQVKKIDWSFYMDKGLDESVNCSLFEKKSNLFLVKSSLDKMMHEKGMELTCPVGEPDERFSLRAKYGFLAPYLLNFYGHNSIDQKDSFPPDLYLDPRVINSYKVPYKGL